MLSSPLESPEGSALLGFGLGQGLPWGRSPWAGSWIGGSPPARKGGAEDGALDEGVTRDGDAGDGAGTLSGTDAGALTEVQTVVLGGTATLTESVFGHLHVCQIPVRGGQSRQYDNILPPAEPSTVLFLLPSLLVSFQFCFWLDMKARQKLHLLK